MRRWLLTLLIALSLLLCVAVAALWVRSEGRALDYVAWRGDATLLVESRAGRLWLERWRGATPLPSGPSRGDPRWTLVGTVNPASGLPIIVGYTVPPPSAENGFGFASIRMTPVPQSPPAGTMHAVAVPWWAVLACSAVPSAAWLARRLRERGRRGSGSCPVCGYDLRATPGRCPECGRLEGTVASLRAGPAPAGLTAPLPPP